jgi:imidazolonepropionase-like amidohydrolase
MYLHFALLKSFRLRYTPILFLAVGFALHSLESLANGDLILRNLEIPDLAGAGVSRRSDIKISKGRIQKISRDIPSDGSRELNLAGATALPGLVDAHIHLRAVPGSQFRNDSEADYWRLFDHHLKAYVAAGVTTVLDAATPEDLITRLKSYEALKVTMPRVAMLAPFMTPEGGYFSSQNMRAKSFANLWPVIRSKDDVVDVLNQAAIHNPSGVKITLEKGFGPFPVWDIFDTEMRNHIVAETKKRQLPLFIHSMNESMHKVALSMQPRAFMHIGYAEGRPSEGFAKDVKDSGAFIVSTLSIDDSALLRWQTERLDSPHIRNLTPKVELDTVRHVPAWNFAFDTTTEVSTPTWIPKVFAKLFQNFFISESVITKRLTSSQRAIKIFYEAGVPIVMGTDSGCWPILPQMFHGYTSIRELELLVDSGLPPIAAIRSATINAALMLGLESEIGSIEAGKVADIIIVDGNPVSNISDLHNLTWVIKGGEIRSPNGWLQ